jgi:hypothetical protein
MLKLKNFIIVFFVALISLLCLISFSYAATVSMTVPAGEEENQKIGLEEGDHILIKFSVVGTEDNYIFFSIIYPNASEKSFGKIASFDYKFVSDMEGEYELKFVNNDISEGKLVTLNYKIDHYVLGIPEMLFQALVIALICLAMITAFILLTPSM